MRFVKASLLAANLLLIPGLALPPPALARVSVGVAINVAPPPLPLYEQPPAPGPGYLWTPGYWAWSAANGDYYWVPGTWVLPPEVGLLWTPGWWGWTDSGYVWSPGYWGPRVGFYGGINYGFGYFGTGYVGGYWHDGAFFYNRAVNNVNVQNIHNVYVDRSVVNEANHRRASYNGGKEGLTARPTADEEWYARQQRSFAPTPAQMQQRELAVGRLAQRHSGQNPRDAAVLATPRAAHFDAPEAVREPAAPREERTWVPPLREAEHVQPFEHRLANAPRFELPHAPAARHAEGPRRR